MPQLLSVIKLSDSYIIQKLIIYFIDDMLIPFQMV